METLTQTPDTSTDVVGTVFEKLKAASKETVEQILAFLQGNTNSVEEAPAVANTDEVVEYGFATEEAVATEEEVETETVIAEAPETQVETMEEVTEEAPEEVVETETEVVDYSQPEDEVSEAVALTDAAEEVAQEPAVDLYDENAHDQIQETELQEEIDSAFIASIGEAPKADIEIRLDEIYSIRVVANEVVSSIEELQNEVTALHAQISTMVSHGELENIVRNIVATTVRDRFAV